MTKCFICQKAPAVEDGYLCVACQERQDNPPHKHEWTSFKFSEDSNVTYYDCECGERTMTAVYDDD